jgi:hypothetical protein
MTQQVVYFPLYAKDHLRNNSLERAMKRAITQDGTRYMRIMIDDEGCGPGYEEITDCRFVTTESEAKEADDYRQIAAGMAADALGELNDD